MSDYYSYCFVRQDLPSPYQTVQAGHAWFKLGARLARQNNPHLDDCNFVLIGVENEAELIVVAKYVMNAGIYHELFFENDGDVGYTALATEPLVGDQRAWFQRFKKLEQIDLL